MSNVWKGRLEPVWKGDKFQRHLYFMVVTMRNQQVLSRRVNEKAFMLSAIVWA